MYNKIYKQPINMSAACSAVSAKDKFSLLLKLRMSNVFFSRLFLILLSLCFAK